MSSNAYKALGFVVWRGGLWYLRRRYPVARARRALAGAAIVFGASVAVVVAQHRHAAGTRPR